MTWVQRFIAHGFIAWGCHPSTLSGATGVSPRAVPDSSDHQSLSRNRRERRDRRELRRQTPNAKRKFLPPPNNALFRLLFTFHFSPFTRANA
jgi:hypothetical protein